MMNVSYYTLYGIVSLKILPLSMFDVKTDEYCG
jgi:hypothetical protein